MATRNSSERSFYAVGNMSIYSDCFRAIRLTRSFLTLIGLLPINTRLRKLQFLLVFSLIATASLMRLWNSERSTFQSDSELSRVVNIASLLMVWIVHIVILLETSYKAEQFENIFLQFEKIEKSLIQQNCEAPNNLQLKFRALRVWVLIFLVTLELLFLTWALHSDGATWFRSALRIYSEVSLRGIFVEFMLLVLLTDDMLRDLTSVTSKVMRDVQATQYDRWTSRQNALKSLSAMGNIRNEIWMVAKMIEDVCECSLIGVLLIMYCDVTFTSYWLYVSFDTETTYTFKTTFIVFLFIRGFILFACCWFCNSCEISERNFIAKLPLKGHKGTDAHLKLIIKDLSLGLLHKRIQFSAGDILAINFCSLGGIIFSAITYVVILIQFRRENPPDK